MDLDRRGFLRIAGTAYLTAGLPVTARALAAPATGGDVSFPQGVGSGDPLPDSILLWTRAQPRQAGAVPLLLQVATSEDFQQVVIESELSARDENDYTVRAQIDNLDPARYYYYRFTAADGSRSRTGRTRTAPDPADAAPLQLAFASCQNYEQGFYGAWARMLADDAGAAPGREIQFVLHLGDFIYERYRNRAVDGQRFVRRLPPFPDGASSGDGDRVWAHTLADYRHLYKVHLGDPHLQAARARWPFICTWDDHEFSNDGFRHFSTYGDEPVAEPERQHGAHRAWFEYMPARVPAPDPELHIYRRLRWGKLADLVLTDLRSYRSPPPLPPGLADDLGMPMKAAELIDIYDGGRDYNRGKPPEFLPFGDGTVPNSARGREPGSMMGATQKAWFKQTLAESPATWKLWGNSLPILPMRLDLESLPFQGLQTSVLGQDAWSGFPAEQRELMSWLQQEGIGGLVSLSGDHHMQAAAALVVDPDVEDSPAVALDFNVTGISSTPQFDSVLNEARIGNPEFMQLVATEVDGARAETWNMSFTHGVLASLAFDKTGSKTVADWLGPNASNPGLSYLDSDSNGYGLAHFTEERCEVELVTIEAPLAETGAEGSPVRHRARFSCPAWSGAESPLLAGPVFEGSPPFPW